MPHVYGYTRVSDELQLGNKTIRDGKVVDNDSMETQRAMIEAWWEANRAHYPKHEFRGFFADPAMSAMKFPLQKRPQGSLMVAGLQRGDLVIAADYERVFRNPEDFVLVSAKLKKMKIRMIFLDTPELDWNSDEGEAFCGIKAYLKQLEAKSTSRRNKASYRSKEKRGIVCGAWVPPGYKRHTRYDKPTKKVIKYNAPCESERRLFRALALIMKQDRDHWTYESFLRYMERTPALKRHNGQKITWETFVLSLFIVTYDFPLENLVTQNRGFRHDLLDEIAGVHVRPEPVPGGCRPKKRISENWAVELYRAEGNVPYRKQLRPLSPARDAASPSAASQPPCD